MGISSTVLLLLSLPISWMLFYRLGRTTIAMSTTTATNTKTNANATKTEIVLDNVVDRILARRPLRRNHDEYECEYDNVAIAMRRIRILNDCSSNADCLSSLCATGTIED